MNQTRNQRSFFIRAFASLNRMVDWGMDAFAIYSVPVLICVISVIAFVFWEPQNLTTPPLQLKVQVRTQELNINEPAKAIAAMRNVPGQLSYTTQLSETPVWMLFTLPQDANKTPTSIEFPSRHTVRISCWDARDMGFLGRADRLGNTEGIRTMKAGFAIDVDPAVGISRMICNAESSGPARILVKAWPTNDLHLSELDFYRSSGLLDGGILILAIFILVMALINRNALYILFAGWLVINLRMAAMSVGTDDQWLGFVIAPNWLLIIRPFTLACLYVLTLALFLNLFKEELKQVGTLTFLRLAKWSCLPIILMSIFMPYRLFLPVIWIFSGLGISILSIFLVNILRKARSPAALWYGASLAATLLTSFYEVVSAALGVSGLIGSLNSITAAMASTLLTSIAIAEQVRQVQQNNREAQDEIRTIFDTFPTGIFSLDLKGRFLRANQAVINMLGFEVLADKGAYWHTFFMPGAWDRLSDLTCSNKDDEIEVKGVAEKGFTHGRIFLVKATLVHDQIMGSLRDITDESKAIRDLQFLANHDSLTKVLNRTGVELAFNVAQHNLNTQVSLAYLDLDRFKLINELFGHAIGDEVLQQVCMRISEVIGLGLKLGRVGGDEFVIVFPAMDIDHATTVCHDITKSISVRPYLMGVNAFFLRSSIGLIEVAPNMQFMDAMAMADHACRLAKTTSGDSVVAYKKDALALKAHENELKLIAILASASATNGMYLEMAPIVSLQSPFSSLNFEILPGMRAPGGAIIPFHELISAAEGSGRMSTIDRWILKNTIAWMGTHFDKLHRTNFVCMKMSASSLNDAMYVDFVYATLGENPNLSSKLCLGITEAMLMQDIETTRRFVDKVRGLGAKVTLNDFGSGYTSFSYLKRFDVDMLKIDANFIVDINHHPGNISVVEAVVSLARNLGMKVIVESPLDMDTAFSLVELGVDYIYGPIVSPACDLDQLLTAVSSAEFVKDAEFSRYLKTLVKTVRDEPASFFGDWVPPDPQELH